MVINPEHPHGFLTLEPLHTAYECWTESHNAGLNIHIEEIKTVSIDPKNKLQLIITDEYPSSPKRVTMWQAGADPFWMQRHLNSLTDDLIFFQWFNVREHKKKKKEEKK